MGYFLIILTTILSILSILSEHFKKSNKWVFSLCSLTLTVGILSVIERCSSNAENGKQQGILIDTLSNLQKKYNSLQDKTLKRVIGDGYAKFSLVQTDRPTYYKVVLFNLNNRYPNYNISMFVHFTNDLAKCYMGSRNDSTYFDSQCFLSKGRTWFVDNIHEDQYRYVDDAIVQSPDSLIFLEVHYRSRSSNVLQQVIVKNTKGAYCQFDYRIWDFNTKPLPTLLEVNESGIPKYKPDWIKAFPIPVPRRAIGSVAN